MACSTCHVVLPKKLFDALPPKKEEEQDMLDLAWGLTDTWVLCADSSQMCNLFSWYMTLYKLHDADLGCVVKSKWANYWKEKCWLCRKIPTICFKQGFIWHWLLGIVLTWLTCTEAIPDLWNTRWLIYIRIWVILGSFEEKSFIFLDEFKFKLLHAKINMQRNSDHYYDFKRFDNPEVLGCWIVMQGAKVTSLRNRLSWTSDITTTGSFNRSINFEKEKSSSILYNLLIIQREVAIIFLLIFKGARRYEPRGAP